MPEEPYSKREQDEWRQDVREALARIEAQTTKTNGRVTRQERIMLVVGTVVGVLLITNGSELVSFLRGII